MKLLVDLTSSNINALSRYRGARPWPAFLVERVSVISGSIQPDETIVLLTHPSSSLAASQSIGFIQTLSTTVHDLLQHDVIIAWHSQIDVATSIADLVADNSESSFIVASLSLDVWHQSILAGAELVSLYRTYGAAQHLVDIVGSDVLSESRANYLLSQYGSIDSMLQAAHRSTSACARSIVIHERQVRLIGTFASPNRS